MPADGQDIEQWKQKYYDQLDRLDQKEQNWDKLETILKRTISRLSLAAEGQDKPLDTLLEELRSHIKQTIQPKRLELIVNKISKILSTLEENQSAPDKQIVNLLQQLLKQIKLPDNRQTLLKRLQKKLDKSTDANKADLLKDTLSLLQSAIVSDTSSTATDSDSDSQGFFGRMFGSDKKDISTPEIQTQTSQPISSSDDQAAYDAALLTTTLIQNLMPLFETIPWPQAIQEDCQSIFTSIKSTQSDNQLNKYLISLTSIIKKWPSSDNIIQNKLTPEILNKESHKNQTSDDSDSTDAINLSDPDIKQDNFTPYRSCLLTLLGQLQNKTPYEDKLQSINTACQTAHDQQAIDHLLLQLSDLITDTSTKPTTHLATSPVSDTEKINQHIEPGIQELLIRLLEQLSVPADLVQDVDDMKHRLEQHTQPSDWKLLLKDVATLINSIRSYLQQEKHDFESFLHQVTDRLKQMDQFLQSESQNIKDAKAQGLVFDSSIHTNVDDIRQDVNQATDLPHLKLLVSDKLEDISQHIKSYRQSEQSRMDNSHTQLNEMHEKMQGLEQQTIDLKKIIIEKNRLALFDALTGIPNRLAYDRKVEEEIARWKRFNHPLSLAVWDIDLFKKVNDTYGHKAGDKVLKTVAQLLNKRIRKTDFLARYGGEEFVMLLPGTEQNESLVLLDQLRHDIQECGFHYHGNAVTITVSCGISQFQSGDNLHQVFDRADKALYQAKDSGRNQCIIGAG